VRTGGPRTIALALLDRQRDAGESAAQEERFGKEVPNSGSPLADSPLVEFVLQQSSAHTKTQSANSQGCRPRSGPSVPVAAERAVEEDESTLAMATVVLVAQLAAIDLARRTDPPSGRDDAAVCT